jgi:tetratricopeptide (TPR) repeat protein
MLKQLVSVTLNFFAGLAGNLIAGWIQQDVWTNFFTPARIIGTIIGVAVMLALIAWLESDRKIPKWLKIAKHQPYLRIIIIIVVVLLLLLVLLILGIVWLWQGYRNLVTIIFILLGILSIPPLQEINVILSSRMRYKTLIGQIVISFAVFFGILSPIFYQAQPPDRFVVLVANFENATSPDHDDNYGITKQLRDELTKVTSEYDDIEIKAIDRSFSDPNDPDVYAAARKYRASFIIWGNYKIQEYFVDFDLYFATISVLGVRSAGEPWSEERTKLTGIELRKNRSREMTYLSLFFAGRFQDEKGNLDTAITLYSEALNKSAEVKSASKLGQAVIHWFRGVAYYNKKDYDRAIEDFGQSIKLDLNDIYTYKWYLWRGFVYGERGDYHQAIEDLSSALRLLPNLGNAYLNRGRVYLSNGDYDKAIADFNKAIEFHNKPIDFLPLDEHIYFDRGDKWSLDEIRSVDFNQAIQFIDEPRILTREDAEIYADRGRAYFAKGDYDQAIMDFDYSIRLNPHHANSYIWYNWRGFAYATRGDYDRAIADYDQTLMLKPDYANAYFNRGNAYFEREDYDRAFADLDRALQIEPSDPDTRNFRDLAYYCKLITLNPNDADAYFGRALAYERLSDWNHALDDYNKTIELKSDFANAYMGRGNSYFNLLKYDEALSDYSKAIELNLNFEGVYRNRGLCYAIKGDNDQAIADYDRAISLKSDFVEAYYDRGRAYLEKGDIQKAVADFRKVLELNTNPALSDLARDQLKTLSVE